MQSLRFVYKSSSIFLTALSLWAGYWFTTQVGTVTTFPSLGVAIFEYILNFATPVPYFLFMVGVEIWGFRCETSDKTELADLRRSAALVTNLNRQLRTETQSHAESKSSYSDTLKAALKLMLCTTTMRFDHRCRVTIYCRQTKTDNELRQIFRFSENQAYKVGGRFKIPIDEGVVGSAWNNHGFKHVAVDHDLGTTEYEAQMNHEISSEGCTAPTCNLSMPSVEFYARALDDHENGNRVGIVVYECTEKGAFDFEEIERALTEQSLDLARFVKHLGRLDLEFSPQTREE